MYNVSNCTPRGTLSGLNPFVPIFLNFRGFSTLTSWGFVSFVRAHVFGLHLNCFIIVVVMMEFKCVILLRFRCLSPSKKMITFNWHWCVKSILKNKILHKQIWHPCTVIRNWNKKCNMRWRMSHLDLLSKRKRRLIHPKVSMGYCVESLGSKPIIACGGVAKEEVIGSCPPLPYWTYDVYLS